MRRVALCLCLLLAFPTSAFAFDTPKALLEALYAPYSKGDDFDWNSFDEAALRSKHLNELFAADAKEAGDGNIGRLDFDPYIDGQDYELSELKIGEPAITGNSATVEVTFVNMTLADDMTYTLVKEGADWKIDDVTSHDKDFPYSLKAIMEGPLGQ